MTKNRELEAYCVVCADVRSHYTDQNDPGSCLCSVCGTVQQLVTPLN